MDLPEPNPISPTAENVAFTRGIARAHYGVPLPGEMSVAHDRMNAFVVTVDSALNVEQRQELARQIAMLAGVRSVENLTMLLRGLDRTFTERLQEHWTGAYESMAGL